MTPYFTVSAPGKVILFGEHAVVYGKVLLICVVTHLFQTAVAGAIDLRTTLEASSSSNVIFELSDIGILENWTVAEIQSLVLNFCKTLHEVEFTENHESTVDEGFVNHIHRFLGAQNSVKTIALTIFLYLYTVSMPSVTGMHIKISSKLPIGAGLGSSASLSVCLTIAFFILSSKLPKISTKICDLSEENKVLLYKYSLLAEKIAHGNPSGIDNTLSLFGGLVKFKQGVSVPITIQRPLKFLLINTHVSREAKAMIIRAREATRDYPEKFQLFDEIEKIVVEAINVLTSSDSLEGLQCLISKNHQYLAELTVSHPKIDEVVSVGDRWGISCKITGAGGGGCVLAYQNDDLDANRIKEFKLELENRNFTVFEVIIGGFGAEIVVK